ncbi:hypothetical protein ATY30_03395 [Sinorhizobium americanum]|nr:hypothetical protein ATY30_03395 [Sinorhizobium americanum]
MIDRIRSVAIETAAILIALSGSVRRAPFGFPCAEGERVFFVFAFHLQLSSPQSPARRLNADQLSDVQPVNRLQTIFVAHALLAEFIIAHAILRRIVSQREFGGDLIGFRRTRGNICTILKPH